MPDTTIDVTSSEQSSAQVSPEIRARVIDQPPRDKARFENTPLAVAVRKLRAALKRAQRVLREKREEDGSNAEMLCEIASHLLQVAALDGLSTTAAIPVVELLLCAIYACTLLLSPYDNQDVNNRARYFAYWKQYLATQLASLGQKQTQWHRRRESLSLEDFTIKQSRKRTSNASPPTPSSQPQQPQPQQPQPQQPQQPQPQPQEEAKSSSFTHAIVVDRNGRVRVEAKSAADTTEEFERLLPLELSLVQYAMCAPIDAEAAAARVLQPVFEGLHTQKTPPHGMFFQHFKPAPW
jgi:hypothetical protein